MTNHILYLIILDAASIVSLPCHKTYQIYLATLYFTLEVLFNISSSNKSLRDVRKNHCHC